MIMMIDMPGVDPNYVSINLPLSIGATFGGQQQPTDDTVDGWL